MKEVEVLLVEDNPTDAELAIRALKKSILCNKLVWVKDGAKALDFVFATGAYSARQVANGSDLILLDFHLPKLGGMEVLRQLKSDERTKAIPVVVVTSSKEGRDEAESYQLGANSYICKPVEFDKFVKVVSDLGIYWVIVGMTWPRLGEFDQQLFQHFRHLVVDVFRTVIRMESQDDKRKPAQQLVDDREHVHLADLLAGGDELHLRQKVNAVGREAPLGAQSTALM